MYKACGATMGDEVLDLDDTPLETVKGRPNPFSAHRLAYIISVLEDETRDVPAAQVEGECEVSLIDFPSRQCLMSPAGLWMVVFWRLPWTNGQDRRPETHDMDYIMGRCARTH